MEKLLHLIDGVARDFVLGNLEVKLENLRGINLAVYETDDEKLVAEGRLEELEQDIALCKAAISETKKTGGYFTRIYRQMQKREYQADTKAFSAESSHEN